MSDTPEEPSVHRDKGKGKAILEEPSERTPLLASQASGSHLAIHSLPSFSHQPRQRSLAFRFFIAFFIFLAITVLVLLILVLFAYSYAAKASEIPRNELLDKALVVKGPDNLNVLNITSEGEIWVNVHARVGLDIGAAMDLKQDDDDEESLFRHIWKSVGRWSVGRLGEISIISGVVEINAPHGTLASIWAPPVSLPLSPDPPQDASWLKHVSIPVCIRPTQNISLLMDFVRESWMHGFITARVVVPSVFVHGGSLGEHGWRSVLNKHESDVSIDVHMKVPSLPGLPMPGHSGPLPSVAELITLKTFDIRSKDKLLRINAIATTIDPLPETMELTIPSLPFIVSLPMENGSPVPMASVHTQPFGLTHPNITLNISGSVLPISSKVSPLVSNMITRYLSAEDNDIVIHTPLLPNLTVPVVFPGPETRPKILRDVAIHDMTIKPTGPGSTFLASGTVFARVVMPAGVEIQIEANAVLPDLLIFDGEPPEMTMSFTTTPLPDPLPKRAFAHIRPDDWVPAESKRDWSRPGEGSAFTMTAEIEDVPLEVLPGRQKEFSAFVRKVIFGKDGAVAGILGSAAVSAGVHGLPLYDDENHQTSNIELSGLPFRGSVPVGRRSSTVSPGKAKERIGKEIDKTKDGVKKGADKGADKIEKGVKKGKDAVRESWEKLKEALDKLPHWHSREN